jgi:hypothetical protein
MGIFYKYENLFNDFKNEEGLYSLYAAFHLLLISEEVSAEEKETIFDYKILEYEIDNIELALNLKNDEDFFVNEYIAHNDKKIKELHGFRLSKATKESIIDKGKHSIRVLDKLSNVYEEEDLNRIKNNLFSKI